MKRDYERYAGEFRITNSFHIGGREIVLGENMGAADGNFYLVADYESNEIFERYINALVSSNYVEIAKVYSERITEAIATLKSERINFNNNIITADKCEPIDNETFIGKIIVLRADTLHPEYRSECYQIVRCMGGNGARADGHGTSVYCRDFFSTEDEKFRRINVIGILKEEYYPEWLKDKLDREKVIKENPDVFSYGNHHFLPVGYLHKSAPIYKTSQFCHTDKELKIWSDTYKSIYGEANKRYSHKDFYEASGNTKCDIFRCLENGKYYLPGEHELFEFTGEFKDNEPTKKKSPKEVER